MQIEQLKYLLEVSKTRSISIAAENLFVSQPAISTSLKNLEKELGATLLIRTKYGTTLTPKGKLISDLAKECIAHFEEFEQAAYHLLRYDLPNYQGHLDIEVVPNISYSILADVLNKFTDKFPQVTLSVIERNPSTILSHLIDHTCQLGIICSSVKTLSEFPHVHTIELFNVKMYALLASSHPLAHKPLITANELASYPIIMHSFYNDDPQLPNRSLDDMDLNIALKCSNMAVIADRVANSNCIATISHLLANTPLFDTKRLVTIPFEEKHPMKIYAAHLPDNPQVELCQHFIEQFNKFY